MVEPVVSVQVSATAKRAKQMVRGPRIYLGEAGGSVLARTFFAGAAPPQVPRPNIYPISATKTISKMSPPSTQSHLLPITFLSRLRASARRG